MDKAKYRIDMSRKQMGFLEINKKNYAIYEGINVIGRDVNATVLLKDLIFSKKHAILSVVDECQHFISDFGSYNGTKLEEKLLEPYKFYKLTGEDRISFSDVAGIYHKLLNLQSNDLETHTTDSQTCDHFALTQKLPNENQNIHNCTTQLFDRSQSVVDQIHVAKSQGLPIHEAQTQKTVVHTQHARDTQDKEISESYELKAPIINKAIVSKIQGVAIHELKIQGLPIPADKTQGLAIHDLETPIVATSTQNAIEVSDLKTPNISQTNETQIDNLMAQETQIYDDVFANDTFRMSLSKSNNSMYGVEVNDTLSPDKYKATDLDASMDLLTEGTTQDLMFMTQASPKRPEHPKVSPLKSVKFADQTAKTKSARQNDSDSDTDVEDSLLANLSLVDKLTELKKRIRNRKTSDAKDNVVGGEDSEGIVGKPKIRKAIENDSSTDMEDNLELIKKIDEASKSNALVATRLDEKSTQTDDDSTTDMEDNLELIHKIDEASKSMENNRSPENKTYSGNKRTTKNKSPEVTKTAKSRRNVKAVAHTVQSIEADDATEEDLLASTQKQSIVDTGSIATTCRQRNMLEVKNASGGDTHLAKTQLNHTNMKNFHIYTARTEQIEGMDEVDKYLAETQKINITDDLDLSPPQLLRDLKHQKSPNSRKSIIDEDYDYLAPTQLLTRPNQDTASLEIETQDVDFLAPTQLLESTSKPISNQSQLNDDDYLAPTQLLHPILSGPASKKPTPKENFDFFFGSKSPIRNTSPNTAKDDSIFNAPTQKLPTTGKSRTAATPKSSKYLKDNDDSNFDVPTQKLSMSSREGVKTESIYDAATQQWSSGDNDEDDIFMAPTQLLNPNGDAESQTVSSMSESMRLHISGINEDDLQANRKLDKPKKLELAKTDTINAGTNLTPVVMLANISNVQNIIDPKTIDKSIYTLANQKQVESETQLEVDFTLATQKLYVEEQTSRPNNPMGNMFDAENTQTQDEIFHSKLASNISQASANSNSENPLYSTGCSKPKPNNEKDSKSLETMGKSSQGKRSERINPISALESNKMSKSLEAEAKPRPVMRSTRSDPVLPVPSNKTNSKPLELEAKPRPMKPVARSDPVSSVESNKKDSTLLESIAKLEPVKRSAPEDLESLPGSNKIENIQKDSNVSPAKRAMRSGPNKSLDSNSGSPNDRKRNLDDGELLNSKRQKKPSWKVMQMEQGKGSKAETLSRRSMRKGATMKEPISNGGDENKDKAGTSKEISDQMEDHNKSSTPKEGMGDGPTVRKSAKPRAKFPTSVASPLTSRTSQRIKRKSKLVRKPDPDEPTPVIEDSDNEVSTSSIESYIKRKVLKMDDTETEYTSSSTTIEAKRNGRAHKIEDYSSDDTDRTESTTSFVDTKRMFEPLHITSQPQNNDIKHKVIFTMLNDEALEEKVEQLGGTVTENIYSCTVLVTNKISRSLKFLIAVGLGKPIANVKWIKESVKKKRFLDPWDFILEDFESEKNFNFVLKDSLCRAYNKKLLGEYTILLAVKKNFDVLKDIVESCGGKVVCRAPAKPPVGKYIVVGYPDEPTKYARYLKQKAPVVSAEAIFSGCLQQKIAINKHLLS